MHLNRVICKEQHDVVLSINAPPEETELVSFLKTCSIHKDLRKGNKSHALALKHGLLLHSIFIGSALVSMYAKCGSLAMAQQIFDELPDTNIVSWNALITGFSQHGRGEQALSCFQRMVDEGLSPNSVTFLCILKACGSLADANMGDRIHADIIRHGFLGHNNALDTMIVDMYAKCRELAKAQQVFDGLLARDVVSWTALITGYVQVGHGEKALDCFKQMQEEGLSPNAVTLCCLLKACGSIGAADVGREIYDEINRKGMLNGDNVLGTALLDMWVKCGALAEARQVFDELPAHDVIAWNALIAGYCQHGYGDEALSCYDQMQHEKISPDAVTFACILQACGSIGAVEKGEAIHLAIIRKDLLGGNSVLSNALVDMYTKCGALTKAQDVFDELPFRNTMTWNTLITGYCQHQKNEEALLCYEQMRHEGLSPDEVTFACILRACGGIGASKKGAEIHCEMIREGLLGKVTNLRNVLVDMYTKCGAFEKAQEVFEKLLVQDVVSWNALMAGYAQAGEYKAVLKSFNRMLEEGIQPTLVTFVVLLNVCSHLGLVHEAQRYFDTMSTSYGISPTKEHHTCMVNLFSRTGHFDKAVAEIKKMPPSDHFTAWSTMLSVCKKWGNVKLARIAFDNAVRSDEKSAVVYLCMSSIYAAAGMKDDADMVEAMRVRNGAWKVPGSFKSDDLSGNVPLLC